MLLKMLAMAAASGPAVFVCGELPLFSTIGNLQLSGSPGRTAELRLTCQPEGDPFRIALLVPQAGEREDFDYADFEEPVARAEHLAPSSVTWAAASSKVSLTAAASGSSDAQAAFEFHAGTAKEWASILSAATAEPGTLTWTQSAYDDLNRHLIATFALDADAVSRLHATVERCLQPPPPEWHAPMLR
jgi:hypothetical protein